MEAKERASGEPLMTSEENKDTLKARVQRAINIYTNHKANNATGETYDGTCEIQNRAPTKCLQEAVWRHESVHQDACRKDALERGPARLQSRLRQMRLVDYAKEEIAGYQAEREFLLSQIDSLKASCRFSLELRSTISGGADAASKSTANAQVTLQPVYLTGLTGETRLAYKTEEVKPKVAASSAEAQNLLRVMGGVCYATYVGGGDVPLEVVSGWITPPADTSKTTPAFAFVIRVGDTQEKRLIRGPCSRVAPLPETAAFWSDRFKRGKQLVTADQVLLEDWKYIGSSDVLAEKKITSTCGGWCWEETTLVLKLRER
jgi:hypothetical protein